MENRLETLARIYSVEEGESITFLDLMRRGIQEKINQVNKPVRNNIKVLRIINIWYIIFDTLSHHQVSEIHVSGIKR